MISFRLKLLLVVLFILQFSFAQITPGVDPISAQVMPKPKNYTFGNDNLQIHDVCRIKYNINSNGSGEVPNHITKILNFYLNTVFKKDQENCKIMRDANFQMKQESMIDKMCRLQKIDQQIDFNINIIDITLTTADTVQDEWYNLTITNSTYWTLNANKYVRFLRGLETYSQLFQQNEEGEENIWVVKNLPISIQDQPDYVYRGLMIDSARHFLSVETIIKTIDSMMFNKLNVLHWHITDTESFPLPLKSFPNITKYGAYSKKRQYSFNDIKTVVEVALLKGIQVIPEVDSPGHSLSWAQSQEFKEIGVVCKAYMGQLDPTLNKTYVAAEGIMRDMNDQFYTAKYVHFGGDEVDQTCWDNRPSIKDYMKQHNISSYSQMQEQYRFKQKGIWKSINETKPAIYWAKNYENFQPDDIIQWWGQTKELNLIANLTNKIILSTHENTYLDVGEGNRYGGSFGSMFNWDVLNSFNPRVSGIKGEIIGGETCLWSEMNNDHTQFQRIWTRNSAFCERLWNVDAAQNELFKTRALVSRLVHMQYRLTDRGIPASPVTVEICERDLSLCYTN